MSGIPVGLLVCHLFMLAFGQDPEQVAPQAYRREFENEWVRVTRVRYAPRERLAPHDHPGLPTVYVYLSDSGPVRFVHAGEEEFTLTRPAVKTGGFRLSRGNRGERHSVESLSDTPSHFLRIELKTQFFDLKNFIGRYPPKPYPRSRSSQEMRVENPQVRVLRLVCAPRRRCDDSGPRNYPALLVAIRPARLQTTGRGADAKTLLMEAGDTRWLQPGETLNAENTAERPAEFLRIDLKTRPTR
jgi:hypothetical protein